MSQLHSVIIGKGAPLIILHGYFGMSDNWKGLGTKFSEFYEVHIIDQRNHGRSFHSDEFDYEILAEDVRAYFEDHKIEKAPVIGHSMGGKVAMLFAVTYPEMVEKLIVADIAPKYYEPHHEHILAALNAVNFDIQDSRKKVEALLKLYISEPGVLQFLLKNVYWREKGQLDFRFNLHSLTENNSEVGAALPSFTSFNGPTLFLRGAQSDYVLDEDITLIEAHFEDAVVITVKNAGHWLHAENPVQFYDEVVRFLGK